MSLQSVQRLINTVVSTTDIKIAGIALSVPVLHNESLTWV